jgi:hypothetical protein
MNLNKYDTIYFNGCSHTEGGGFEASKPNIINAYKEQYGFEYKSEKEVCYPTIVQNLLPNIKVINEAKSGAGTERVIRKVWEYIFSRRLSDVQKTIFILELPGAVTRLDLFSTKQFKHLVGNVQYGNGGKIKDTQVAIDWIYGPQLDEEYRNKLRKIIKEYTEEFMHPEIQDKKVAYSLFGLANFMLMHNIEFYFTGDTSYTEYHLNLQYDYPTFNSEHILQLKINNKYYSNIIQLVLDTKTQISYELGFDITKDGHPGFQAHKMWGEEIAQFLKNKYS